MQQAEQGICKTDLILLTHAGCAFKEYSASLINKDKRPSVLAKLHELVQAVAELPGKVRHKEQERGL